MELILIRHGITQGNKEKRFVGRLDVPLCPEGEALARRVAGTLPEVEHLYVSPMLRCRQTAELLWPGVAGTEVEDLHETDFGPFEGKNHEELKDDPAYRRWLAGELSVGEPAADCARRGVKALAQLTAEAAAAGQEKIGVVTHGGLMMGMLTMLGQPPRARFYDWYPPNCGGYRAELMLRPFGLRVLESVGNPPEKKGM